MSFTFAMVANISVIDSLSPALSLREREWQ
jgi:hypothetical protein